MIECLILGDSIAAAVARRRPDCVADAQAGRPSPLQRPPAGPARVVVISLGSNDTRAVPTLDHLRSLRAAASAALVLWFVPANKARAAEAVRQVAWEFGDRTIEIGPLVYADGVHPTGRGYRILADAIPTR